MPKPSAKPPRERDPDARKERILAAAGEVFAEIGYAHGSIASIIIVDALAGKTLKNTHREMAVHQIVAMCVHFDHCREVIGLLGFAVPETDTAIARLADNIAALAPGGLRSPATRQASPTKRTNS